MLPQMGAYVQNHVGSGFQLRSLYKSLHQDVKWRKKFGRHRSKLPTIGFVKQGIWAERHSSSRSDTCTLSNSFSRNGTFR